MKVTAIIVLGLVAGLTLPDSDAANAGVGSPRYGDCFFSKLKHRLVARVRDEEGSLRQDGNRIVFNRLRKRCHGGRATVLNTDRIKFIVHAIGQTTGRISLAGGNFAPGRTPEPEGSEIEMTVLLKNELTELELDGTGGDDTIRGGALMTGQALNLNPSVEPLAPDPDLFLPVTGASRSFAFKLGPGNDALDLGGGPEFVGPAQLWYVLAMLGDGNDRYVGTSGFDFILAGSGTNSVSTLGNDDAVNVHNGVPDVVDCGPGDDVVEADAFDSVVGCERAAFVGIAD